MQKRIEVSQETMDRLEAMAFSEGIPVKDLMEREIAFISNRIKSVDLPLPGEPENAFDFEEAGKRISFMDSEGSVHDMDMPSWEEWEEFQNWKSNPIPPEENTYTKKPTLWEQIQDIESPMVKINS